MTQDLKAVACIDGDGFDRENFVGLDEFGIQIDFLAVDFSGK